MSLTWAFSIFEDALSRFVIALGLEWVRVPELRRWGSQLVAIRCPILRLMINMRGARRVPGVPAS
jgi:hypothetical protein